MKTLQRLRPHRPDRTCVRRFPNRGSPVHSSLQTVLRIPTVPAARFLARIERFLVEVRPRNQEELTLLNNGIRILARKARSRITLRGKRLAVLRTDLASQRAEFTRAVENRQGLAKQLTTRKLVATREQVQLQIAETSATLSATDRVIRAVRSRIVSAEDQEKRQLQELKLLEEARRKLGNAHGGEGNGRGSVRQP